MSVRKLTANILTVLALVSGLSVANAQQYAPVNDPMAFDPDFRWFEPLHDVDLASMKPSKRANLGWFGTYDRLALYGSRPELNNSQASEIKMDRGWGHRYELGYMLENDHGWLFSMTEMSVGQFDTVVVERVNRIANDPPTNVQPPFGFPNPLGDGNNLGFNQRLLFVQDTENVVSMDSYELSKTWRMTPYRYGGFLEPMVGVRWFRVDDQNSDMDHESSLDLDQAVGGVLPLAEFGDAERITTDHIVTENEMLAGQLGFRYTKFRDRFTFTTDFRAFTGPSWQCSKAVRGEIITVYDGPGVGADVSNVLIRQTAPEYSDNEEWMVGFDVRGSVGYQLTKAISLRGGFQVIDIATGLWRGGNNFGGIRGGDQDQDLVLAGATFGVTFNR